MRQTVEYVFPYMHKRNEKKDSHETKISFSEAVFSFAGSLITGIVVIFAVFSLLARSVTVDGDSMNPTLINKDRLFISELVYTPKSGDIVIISREQTKEEPLVKRVIAVEGDEVNIDFAEHTVTVNGEPLSQDYEVMAPISRHGDVEFPVTVPPDCVFVLGDNRNNSRDSRYSDIGFIDIDRILGKAVLRIYPFSTIKTF